MINDIAMIAAAVAIAVVVLRPAMLKSQSWRATVTPLASIIGSGFLVAGPVIGHAAGHWAWAAMAGLCALSYLFGAAIRSNIRRAEPLLADNPPNWLRGVDRAGDAALVIAYFVSVAYYLYLLAAFALKAGGIVDPNMARTVTTVILIGLAVLGWLGGLHWLENVELVSVGLKLCAIGGIIAALVAANSSAAIDGSFALLPVASTTTSGFESVRILLGLVILVQGFETSRYLGGSYDADMRVRTMRHAQLIAFAIYIAFIALLTPYIDGRLPPTGGETHIIDLIRPVGTFVAPFVIAAALMSQLSAAVADMNGASGLIGSASRQRVSVKLAYVVSATASIAVVWAGDIFSIIAWASKAFVLFYGIEAGTALALEWQQGKARRWGLIALYAFGVVMAVLVIALGTSAEA